ncbi:hypothetical protein HDU98_011548 [Podochytrium sp. JEL0797]|nr:hypothetical protein HDU98_011548 [Podochytrium sp. JEL0797]
MSAITRPKLFAILLCITLSVCAIVGGLTAIGVTAKKQAIGKEDYFVKSDEPDPNSAFIEVDVITSGIDPNGLTARVIYSFNLSVDQLSFTFAVQGTYGVSSNPKPLPVVLYMSGVPNGFSIFYATNNADALLEVIGNADISRSLTVKSFAIMLTLVLWFLAIIAGSFTCCVWIFERKAEPAHVAFMCALLFASPNVRNTMPSAPPIGALIDQMCLVWVMMILGACVMALMVKLIMQLVSEK